MVLLARELASRFFLVEGFFVVIATSFYRPLTRAQNQISSRFPGSASLHPGLHSAVGFADSLKGLSHEKFGALWSSLQRLNGATKDIGAVSQLGTIAFRFR
jgi:hypothetical protein